MTEHHDKKRVLVVDDHQDAAHTLRMLLELEGYEVQIALGGIAALHEIKHFYPDVIILDIGMPDVDGYEVAKLLRADPAYRNANLIALTGHCRAEDRARSQEAGFDHHLAKPAGRADLLNAVAAVRNPL